MFGAAQDLLNGQIRQGANVTSQSATRLRILVNERTLRHEQHFNSKACHGTVKIAVLG